jgi:tetratricopeptide (TPR) repeat protein
MRRTTLWTLVVIAAAVGGSIALAASQARVAGTVVDTAGAPIAGATVVVTCPETPSFRKVLEVNAQGQFKILLLDATKAYVFAAEAPGYSGFEREVKVSVGTMDNQITMELMSLEQTAAAEREAILEQPGYKEHNEGLELLRAGDSAGARAKFAEAVAAVPDLAAAWAGMAEIDFDSGSYQDAFDNAEACLEHDDENVKCVAIAANAARELGDMEVNQRYVERYEELNPDDPTTLFNQAAEFLNALDDDQARPLLEQCLEVDPEFPQCLFEYGMLLLRSGDLEGAKAQLTTYLEVAPDGPDAAAAAETVKYL